MIQDGRNFSDTKQQGGIGLRETGPSYTLDSTGGQGVITSGGVSDRCAYDPQPDGRRYAACGDGVVANVAEWIALRLLDAVRSNQKKAA